MNPYLHTFEKIIDGAKEQVDVITQDEFDPKRSIIFVNFYKDVKGVDHSNNIIFDIDSIHDYVFKHNATKFPQKERNITDADKKRIIMYKKAMDSGLLEHPIATEEDVHDILTNIWLGKPISTEILLSIKHLVKVGDVISVCCKLFNNGNTIDREKAVSTLKSQETTVIFRNSSVSYKGIDEEEVEVFAISYSNENNEICNRLLMFIHHYGIVELGVNVPKPNTVIMENPFDFTKYEKKIHSSIIDIIEQYIDIIFI